MRREPLRRRLLRWLRARTRWPPVGSIRFGSLRRVEPISRDWGFDRGKPIDRYYIEQFLARRAADIRGRVLEVGSDTHTRAFGGERVTRSEVLHVAEQHPKVTIIGDLTQPDTIPHEAFDCMIVTQTLHVIYDVHAVVHTMHRALRPGGVALVTVPGITKISRYDMDRWGQYWSFTTRSARRLFEEAFPPDHVTVEAYGNVLAAVAFLHGLSAAELREAELRHADADFETLIGIRAVKPQT